MNSNLPEAAWPDSALRRWQAGERSGFAEVYRRCFSRVLEAVRLEMGAKLRVHSDSQDIVQDVFLRLFKSPPPSSIQSEPQLHVYLFKATVHRLCDLGRYRNAFKRSAEEVGLDLNSCMSTSWPRRHCDLSGDPSRKSSNIATERRDRRDPRRPSGTA